MPRATITSNAVAAPPGWDFSNSNNAAIGGRASWGGVLDRVIGDGIQGLPGEVDIEQVEGAAHVEDRVAPHVVDHHPPGLHRARRDHAAVEPDLAIGAVVDVERDQIGVLARDRPRAAVRHGLASALSHDNRALT